MTAATAMSLPLLIVTSAPNSRARLEARVVDVDRDDVRGRVELRGHDGREADRPGADDRDGVARLDAAVEDADLEGRGQDVRQEEHLLVRQRVRHPVDRRVRERHTRVLGLQPVDQVAEDPASSAGAETVVAFLAEATATARRDARDEHAVTDLEGRDGAAFLDDRADRLVAKDRPRLSPRARPL